MRYFSLITILLFSITSTYAQKVNVKKEFEFAQKQTDYMLKQIPDTKASKEQVSPRTYENGQLKLVIPKDWTSGFFPGVLWYLFEYTKDTKWLNEAKKFTTNLEKEQYDLGTHDLGFMIFCSYGNGYRLTNDESYKNIIVQAAKSLASRFSANTGLIRSWDGHRNLWQYPVIIDNMMNLELLFEATKLTGDSTFHKIAISHANNTMKNHFRQDFSSYHVVDYNPLTGAVNKQMTHQGYADQSSWARGQAWGLYGFTLCYRYTGDKKYLNHANNIASYIINFPGTPEDHIPYWDYNDPAIPNTSRDASAAAITASALQELAQYSNNKKYTKKANSILHSLSKNYHSPENKNGGFILIHSTGNRPGKSEIDVPLTYADYYYLEALLRKKKYAAN